jgi:hypothetical protein
MAAPAELYVQLDFKLVAWSFLDWRILVKTSTPLYALKRSIVERHGRMAELHIYKDQVLPENELSNGRCTSLGVVRTSVRTKHALAGVVFLFALGDPSGGGGVPVDSSCRACSIALPLDAADAATLAEYGIVGGPRGNAPKTTLYYNFKPHDASDALLLATHTRGRVGVDAGAT